MNNYGEFRNNKAREEAPSISNMSSLEDKHLNRRFPYSSTPSGSPNHILNSDQGSLKFQKANLNLPLGSLSNASHFTVDRLSKDEHLFNHIQRSNITVRERQYKGHDSTTSTISPIPANETRNMIQYTRPRGTQQMYSAESAEAEQSIVRKNIFTQQDMSFSTGTPYACGRSESSSGSCSSRNVFPYPAVSVMDGLDSGEMLANSLKLLVAIRNLESEKLRLLGPKRKDKPEDKIKLYEFTQDTFKYVNSEAAIYALYLLFSCFNTKEAEQRFRDCWPVYEKKLEGIFRRVALEWLKELMEENHTFLKGIKSEAIGGLLVNPGGERFISMMRQFCQFVMLTLAERKQAIVKQKVLRLAVPTSDPEVTNRQLHVLRHRIQKHQEEALGKYKRILKNEVAYSQRMKELDDYSQKISREGSLLAARVKGSICNYPEIFGEPSEDDLKARECYQLTIKVPRLIENDHYDDFLRDRLTAELHVKADEIYKPASLLQDVVEEFDKIWHILEMDRRKPMVLHCSNLPLQMLHTDGSMPSMNAFFDTLFNSVDAVLSDPYLNADTPRDLQKDYSAVILRISYLNMLENKIKEFEISDNAYTEVASATNSMMKIRLDQFDWSVLSKIHESKIELLDITPLRIFDINRVSGKTPAIHNFLDSSSSSSSGENVTVIRRRRAIKLIPRAMRQGCNNTSPRDTPDSGTSTPVNPLNGSGLLRLYKDMSMKLSATPLSSQGSTTSVMAVSESGNAEATSQNTEVNTSLNISIVSSRSNANLSTSFSNTPIEQSPNTTSDTLSVKSVSFSQRNLSNVSDANISVGLDESTQERVTKLLATVARSSRPSMPATEDLSSAEQMKTRASVGLNLNDLHLTQPDRVACFDNISMIEDWEDSKGIMETSYIDLFRNSDSDD